MLSRLIVRPIFRWLRRRLPPLSATENIALAAGDTWWEAELFNGKPDWQKLQQLTAPKLTLEEQSFIDHKVNPLCDLINDWQYVDQQTIPDNIWQYLKQAGFWGLQIPKNYGGLGFSTYAHSVIISRLASRSLSVAVIAMVPNSLGPAELLLHYGTAAQKDYYLPRLAKGDEIPCFALTGLEAGSDAGSLTDQGVAGYGDYQGKKILGITLTWHKRYITLAPVATLVGLAFKLFDPDHLLSQKTTIGMTLALIPTNHPGIIIGKQHRPISLAFPNGPTSGESVFIPLDWIIGGVEKAGQGWQMLMECLAIGRGISLPALSAGISQACYRHTSSYATVRTQFKQAIGQFEGIMQPLARIGGLTFLIEAVRSITAQAVDQKIKPTIASAIAKYHLTEQARIIINDAIDIHGGRAIQHGPRNYLLLPYLGALMGITVEGANILTRNLIIFGQGAIRCHLFLQQEMQLLAQPESTHNLNAFSKILRQHIQHGLVNIMRVMGANLTNSYNLRVKTINNPANNYYYRQAARMSAALAVVSDLTLLILGGELKRREFLSARLGDVLSYLYLLSVSLQYANQQTIDMQVYVDWAAAYCLAKIQIAFDEFFDNFGITGKVLRRLLFPWGRAYAMPKDQDSRKVAQSMLTPSLLREQVSAVCHRHQNVDDVTGRLENIFNLHHGVTDIANKLAQARLSGNLDRQTSEATQLADAVTLRILSVEELQLWQTYTAARLDVLQVDEF